MLIWLNDRKFSEKNVLQIANVVVTLCIDAISLKGLQFLCLGGGLYSTNIMSTVQNQF